MKRFYLFYFHDGGIQILDRANSHKPVFDNEPDGKDKPKTFKDEDSAIACRDCLNAEQELVELADEIIFEMNNLLTSPRNN